MSAVDWDKVYEGHFNQLGFTSWNGLNIGRLTLAIWILASHLALIIFLLSKAALRKQPKNLLIINVSLTNLVVGVFLVPAKLHFITSEVDRDCQLSMAWTLMNDYFQVGCSFVFFIVFVCFVFGLLVISLWHTFFSPKSKSYIYTIAQIQ